MIDNAFTYPGDVYELIRSYYRDIHVEAQFLSDCGVRAGARVIDYGCGTGTLSRLMAGRGANVLGLDPSERFIDFAANHADSKKTQGILDFRVGGIPKSRLDCSNDIVVCAFNTIAYSRDFGEVADTLKQFNTSLRAGGTVIVEFAMFLRLFQDFKAQMVVNHKNGDLSVNRNINHRCDWFNGYLFHDEFVTIARPNAPVTVHHEAHRQLLIVPAFLSTMIEDAGFTGVETYTSWSKSRVVGAESTVTFVARKP